MVEAIYSDHGTSVDHEMERNNQGESVCNATQQSEV